MATFEKITKANAALKELIQADRQNKYILASAARIKLAQNIRLLKPELEEYIAEYNSLVKKFGKEDGNGGYVVDKTDVGYAEFSEEITKLNKSDSGVEFRKLSEEDLFGPDKSKPNQIDLVLLTDLIESGIVE